MANDINVVTLSGRLTNDAQFRQFNDGGIINFDVAVNRTQKGADGQFTNVASFFNVSYSSKGAANFVTYLKKGTQVMISGSLVQDTWEDKQTGQKRSAVKIRANDVMLAGGGNNQNSQQGFAQPQQNFNQQPVQQNYQRQPQYQQMPQGVQQGFQQQPQQFQNQSGFVQGHQQMNQNYQNPAVDLNNFPDEVPF